MLMIAGAIVAVAVLAKFNFSPSQLLDTAAAKHPDGRAILGPGTYLTTPVAGHLHRPDDLHRHRRACRTS